MKKSLMFLSLLLTSNMTLADVSVKTASSGGSDGTGGSNPINTGEMLYACNAGVGHGSRAPAPPKKDCTDSSENCVSEVVNDATRGSDSLRVNGSTLVGPSTGRKTLYSASEQWNNSISDLSFSFASENYGANFHVDFCYKGPVSYYKAGKNGCGKGSAQNGDYCYGEPSATSNSNNDNENADSNNNGQTNSKLPKDLSEGIYTLSAFLAAGNSKYIQNSNLYVKFQYACTFRSTKQGVSESGADNNINIDAAPGIYTPFNTSQMAMYEAQLNTMVKLVPRYCVIRFDFKESSTNVRQYKIDDTDFTVGLDIQKQSADDEEEDKK